MKIFITGGSGFIGSYVVKHLSAAHEVTILLRDNSNTSRLTTVLNSVNVVRGELSDSEFIQTILNKVKPDVVIHLAWSGVHNKYRNDNLQVDNVFHSISLFRAAANAGVTAFIGLGSQAEYGPCENVISEKQTTNPTTLYGASKLSTCILLQNLAEAAKIRFAWARIFSTYGPSDHPEWMIPYLIRSLIKGERPALTKGEQLWDYLYVRDAALAISALATNQDAQGIYNLGSGQAVPLRKIIENIRNEINPDLPLGFGEVPYRPDQVMHLEADISRIQQSIGWKPATSLAEGLIETIAWYRSAASL